MQRWGSVNYKAPGPSEMPRAGVGWTPPPLKLFLGGQEPPQTREQPSPIHPQDFTSPPLSPPGFAGAAAESPGGFVRLAGGPSRCAGRVEVLHNGTWGTVCDDSWGSPEGRVVCRQLNCGTVLSVASGARYGQGTGQIWLDEVNCTGEERNLSECRARPWGEHNCHHVEDASVECSGSPGQQQSGCAPPPPLHPFLLYRR